MDASPRRTSLFFRLFRRYWWTFFLTVLALWSWGLYAWGAYSVYETHPAFSQNTQAAQILLKVSQLIQLPQDETPTMATIDNAEQAQQNQPFLANAEDGDILIVYPQAGEALLYRPSTDKLIAVGPVTNAQPVQFSSPSAPAGTSTNASTANFKN